MWINFNLIFSIFVLSVWWNYHWCTDFAHITFSCMSRRVLFVIIFIFAGLQTISCTEFVVRLTIHVSCSVCSFIITCWIPRVLLHFFICCYVPNPTCPVQSVHLLLLTKFHVSGCCSLLIPSSRKLKKMFAWPPCCHFTIYEVFTLTKICHFCTSCYPASLWDPKPY
jgi:hypothetical protein